MSVLLKKINAVTARMSAAAAYTLDVTVNAAAVTAHMHPFEPTTTTRKKMRSFFVKIIDVQRH